jgi:hypothetical protein
MVIRRYSSNAIQETRNAHRYATFPQYFEHSDMNLHYRRCRHTVDAYIMRCIILYLQLHLNNSTGWNNVNISTTLNAHEVLGDVYRTNLTGSQTLHSKLEKAKEKSLQCWQKKHARTARMHTCTPDRPHAHAPMCRRAHTHTHTHTDNMENIWNILINITHLGILSSLKKYAPIM